MASWFSLFQSPQSRRSSSQKIAARLAVESLEDRLAPATHAITSALLAGLGSAASGAPITSVATRETLGTFNPASGQWFLRDSNQAGAPTIAPFGYGGAGWTPVAGDWNGDGIASPGVVSPDSVWYLKNASTAGTPDVTPFAYGGAGWIPFAGDWDGNGTTTIGSFDPSTGTWYLHNSNSSGAPDVTPFQYGAPGWVPVAGDWNGDGTTTIGVVDPTTGTWYLRNNNTSGSPDITPFAYGGAGWTSVVGDWDGNGTTTVGTVDPTGTWYLHNNNTSGPPDIIPFAYGGAGWTPVTGAWSLANLVITRGPTAPVQAAAPTPNGVPAQNPTHSGSPVLYLSSETLDPFNPGTIQLIGVSGTRAVGELTISNTGPVSSVLHYQLGGAFGGYYPLLGAVIPYALAASAPEGQVVGGQSRRIMIVADAGNFSLTMATGWVGGIRVTSDSQGVISSVTVPLSVLPSAQSSYYQMQYIDSLQRQYQALWGLN